MATLKIPVIYDNPDKFDVVGIPGIIFDAIYLVPREQRSHIDNVIIDGILYLTGPEAELQIILPVIQRVIKEYAQWLLKQADALKISDEVTS